MKLARLVALSKIILFGHVLNWFWRDRETRRAVRSDVLSRVIPCYFMRYLPAAAAVPERPVEKMTRMKKFLQSGCKGKITHRHWFRLVSAVYVKIAPKN